MQALLLKTKDAIEPQAMLRWLGYLELAAIAAIILCHTVLMSVIERLAEPPSPAAAVAMLAVLGAVSFTPLFKFKVNTRLAIIAGELLLLTIASVFGIPRLFGVLYLILVARAGVVLDQRGLIMIIVFAILCHFGGKELRYFLTEKAIFSMGMAQHLIHVVVFGRMINFIFGVVFAGICVVALKSEREARLQKEALNREMEELARKVERTRIAREIHDSVGHTLTALNMQIELAQKASKKAPEKVDDALFNARNLAGQARRDLQQAVRSPGHIELNLEDAIRALIEDYEKQKLFDIQATLDLPELSKDARHEVFNIVKEALNNIKKYAEARRVTVALQREDGNLLVEIADNGRGFDMAEVKPTSYGLRGMKERVRNIKGEISISSSPGEGTRIKIKVPGGENE